MNENKKEKTIDIIIPAGYRSFKEKLDIHLNRGLNVITGINGSGKTQLLEYIYKSNNYNILFFNSGQFYSNSSNRKILKNRNFYNGKNYYNEYGEIDINSVLNGIEYDYKVYTQKEGYYKLYNSLNDVYNFLFCDTHFLYKYKKGIFRMEFFKKISESISKELNININEIYKKFGILNEEDLKYKIEEYLKKEGKIIRRGTKQSIAEYKNFKEDIQNQNTINEIALQNFISENNINTKGDLLKFLDEIINPLNSMNNIIDKLSDIIYDDVIKHPKERNDNKKIWKRLNIELYKHRYDNVFNYELEKPNILLDYYDIVFKSKQKDNSEERIFFENLSSGEKIIFELICYAFIIEFNNIKNKTKMLLLDEFDANLNPQLAKLLIETIREELIKKDITVILTTHSPSTVAEVEPEELFLMENEKGEHILQKAGDENGKKEILEKLAPKFVYEKELGFMGILAKTQKEYIIFVEGKSDEIHFNTARQYLNLDDNYEFIECGCASRVINLLKVIKDIELFDRLLKNKIIIGLCDFDNEPCVQISELIDKNYKSQINNNSLQKYCQKIHDKINSNVELIFDIENKNNTNLNIRLIMLTPDKYSDFWKTKNFDLEHMYNIEKYQNARKQEINIMKKKNKTDLNNLNCEEIDDIKYDNISFESNPEYYDTCLDSDGKIKFAEYVSKNPQEFKEAFETNFRRVFNIINKIRCNL